MLEPINLSETEYRSLPRIANSDLTELHFLQMGYAVRPIYPSTAQFGTSYHQLILEPEKPVNWDLHTEKQRHDLMHMQRAWQHFLSLYQQKGPFSFSSTEQILLFDQSTPAGTVACKAKLDAVGLYQDQPWVIDLKTTSAASLKEFVKCFDKYDYDRQAAFYLDALSLKLDQSLHNNVYFIGLQKQRPYHVYVVDMNQHPRMMQVGRQKYRNLLQKAVRELENPTGWRPSAWGVGLRAWG